MDDEKKLSDTVNQSGFPLQIAVASLVRRTSDQHGWSLVYTEHSWKNHTDGSAGFVDVVLADKYSTSVLVIECKRVLDSSWIFLNPDPKTMSRRHAKAWITRRKNNDFTYYDWRDLPLDPPTPESEYCVVPGQDARSRPMLERIAAEVVSATEAIAMEERPFQAQRGEGLRMYFGVVITTAKLKTCAFDPDQVSIRDGKVLDPQFQDVGCVRFRKQLSTRQLPPPQVLGDQPSALVRAKEHTVFVVQSESFLGFLQGFQVDDAALRSLD